ncbi:sulfurtransferase [Riemerella anatipestifer]|uniref:sulfurtransferase n=1 Tax=Riemerella anatipestifer TaxID=34085 RepID=UPI00129E6094|nr:sulfurtransferase [Riemerella anatipestifer]MBT0550872.1 sulfurtransferase [Riemerella anatipestifer]MBT0553018.1 sulfurtransferase [Riemerella anatipestifer]MCE3023714.1 sulfurtransferase [Riemerella anatipestifer]MCU7541844.1 sulfurtransferase [Riemerella anatipestifer]MCU7559635.1 sulfurtransferase [Riemerella anatipestifer]
MSPIISVEELQNLDASNIILINAGNNFNKYSEEHLKDALYVDLDKDLAEVPINPATGGRHPLPPIDKFLELIRNLGITKKSHIVIYDDQNGANAAARFWWMLNAVGIEKVQVLSGGLAHAKQNHYSISAEIIKPNPSEDTIKVDHWQLPLADISFMKEIYEDPTYTIIDVRDTTRYKGISEPIDLIAGHIPNAINIPFSENLTSEGLFKTTEELKILYNTLLKERDLKKVVVHCGSGVTACHTLLAMSHAGLQPSILYVGSWSEWSRNNLPIETI